MGRPLAKRFFGNRNVGSASTTADDNLGGKRVASVTLGTLGSYTVRPTVTFSLPDLTGVGAVRATGTVTSEIVSATTSNGLTGTGYEVGDLVEFDGVDGVIGYVSAVGGGVGEIQGIQFTQAGTSRGEFTTLPADVTDLAVIGGSGTLGTVNVAFRAKAVVITEPGSGYTDATDAAPTFTQSVTGTSVVESDGQANASNNPVGTNENAIVIRAKTTSGGTAQRGDIVKQQSTRRYRVKTGDGSAVCKLVASDSPAVNQAYVLATDITGNSYYVTKITSRKCVITRKSGGANYEFADPTTYPNGQVVKWTFGTQVLNSSVKIENA